MSAALMGLRRWLFQRRVQKLLDLPLDKFSGFDEKDDGWRFYILAKAFDAGNSPPKDTALAFRCYLRSAKAGLPLGQICVGLAYQTGTGTLVDKVAAHGWWHTAAAQGDPGRKVLENLLLG